MTMSIPSQDEPLTNRPVVSVVTKTPKESWALLEDLALYDNESWNEPRDFAKLVKGIALPQDVPITSDHRLIKLENQHEVVNLDSARMRFNLRRISLTWFPTRSVGSSNAIALDSPYFLVLITETSQSRQHESHKPPTVKLFDVDYGRISIHHLCEEHV
ncbi:hypothetical protein Tco_0809476 [Tanacetum coccineum]